MQKNSKNQEYTIGLFNKDDYKPITENRAQLRNKLGCSFQLQVHPDKNNKLISGDQLQMYSTLSSSLPPNNVTSKKIIPSFQFKYSKEHKENILRNILHNSQLLNINNQYNKEMTVNDCKGLIEQLDNKVEYEIAMKEDYKRKYLEKRKECQEMVIGNLIQRKLVQKAMKNKSLVQAVKVYEPKGKRFKKEGMKRKGKKGRESISSDKNTLDSGLLDKYVTLRKKAEIEMEKTISMFNDKYKTMSKDKNESLSRSVQNIEKMSSSLTTLNPSIKIPETIDSNMLNKLSIQDKTRRSISSAKSSKHKSNTSFNIEQTLTDFKNVNKIDLVIHLNNTMHKYPSAYRPAIQSYINSILKTLYDNFDSITTDIINELLEELLIDLQQIETIRDRQETKNSFIIYLRKTARQEVKDTKKIELKVNANVINSETNRSIPYKSIDPYFVKKKQDEEVQTIFSYEDILKQNEFYHKPYNSQIINFMKCRNNLPYSVSANFTLINNCENYKHTYLEQMLLSGEFYKRNIFHIYDEVIHEICEELLHEQLDYSIKVIDEYFKEEYNKEKEKTST